MPIQNLTCRKDFSQWFEFTNRHGRFLVFLFFICRVVNHVVNHAHTINCIPWFHRIFGISASIVIGWKSPTPWEVVTLLRTWFGQNQQPCTDHCKKSTHLITPLDTVVLSDLKGCYPWLNEHRIFFRSSKFNKKELHDMLHRLIMFVCSAA